MGAVTSGVCVVHCALLPLVIAWFPAAAARWASSEVMHGWLTGIALVSGLAAFVPGWLRHREGRVWSWAISGWLLILSVGPDGAWDSAGGGGGLFTLAGGVVLMVAHRLNHSLSYWCDRS